MKSALSGISELKKLILFSTETTILIAGPLCEFGPYISSICPQMEAPSAALYWAPQSSDMLYPLGSTKNLRNKSLQDLQLAKSGANSPSSPNSSSSRPRQGNLFVQYTMLEKIWRISLYVLLESLVESRCM